LSDDIIFIRGETINLCIPNVDSDSVQLWTEIINDQKVNTLIGQGYFPIDKHNQVDYIKEILKSKSRILLQIIAKKTNKFLGVVSLSEIDFINRRAQLSTVCPLKCESAKYAALQARALISDHAFQKLGLSSVYSYQAYPENKRWAQLSEVIGFLPSGFSMSSYQINGELTHRLIISLTSDSYWRLLNNENSLWPGTDHIKIRVAKLTADKSLADSLFTFVSAMRDQYVYPD